MLSPSYPQRAPWGTAGLLRAWQSEALSKYLDQAPRDFLVAATPGAGKTRFALQLAQELLHSGVVNQVIVVAPTEHLKSQWADAAAKLSIRLNPDFKNSDGEVSRQFHGVVVTYAQVAMKPYLHTRMTKERASLVILDEVHHGGDTLSWGEAIRDAYTPAVRRLLLSGTPFRSDDSPIPFVSYYPGAKGELISQTDYNYGYSRALKDGVVRPVLFHVYAGRMRWRTRAGDELEAHLGQDNTKDVTSQAWRTALDPSGEWMPQILKAADQRLSEIRKHVPDAGGLVIATDQSTARAYAKILRGITGEPATIVLSDEKDASSRIESFSASDSRWMVAVRMVSEGVDVPRLAVGVYATSSATPLFFAQAIGRFVRARRKGEAASVFLPNVPQLMALAAELERERDHVLGAHQEHIDEDGYDSLAEANSSEAASDELTHEFEYQAISAIAHFDKVVFDGEEFGELAEAGTLEEQEFIGLPGLLEPEHVHELLRARQNRQRRIKAQREAQLRDDEKQQSTLPAPLHRTLKEQRKLLHSLVAVYSKHSGDPHAMIHAELRRICGGPAVPQATVAQLQNRIDTLRSRLKK